VGFSDAANSSDKNNMAVISVKWPNRAIREKKKCGPLRGLESALVMQGRTPEASDSAHFKYRRK